MSNVQCPKSYYRNTDIGLWTLDFRFSLAHCNNRGSLLKSVAVHVVILRLTHFCDTEAQHAKYLAINAERVGPPGKVSIRIAGECFKPGDPFVSLQHRRDENDGFFSQPRD